MNAGLLVFILLLALSFLGIPIFVALGIGTLVALNMADLPLLVLPQKLFAGMNSSSLLAIPFFILAGNLMSRSITGKLIDVANALIGRIKGSLALVTVVASALFGAISGSGVATASAIGGLTIPAMKKEGYPAPFAVAVSSISSILGPIIPPSITLIVYASITNVSVSKLFIGSVIPGLMLVLCLMGYALVYGKRYNLPAHEKMPAKEVAKTFKSGIWALLMPIIILGGIFGGIFTATEAAAGGTPVTEQIQIYTDCDVIMQILPTHAIIRQSVEAAVKYGKKGNIIIDLSSTAPDIIRELYQEVKDAGMSLLDSPISGGNPMAIAGTLAIMTGGDREAFDKVKPLLECMGHPVYTGGSGSGSVTKLVNNMVAGAYMVVIAEAYAFAAKAGIDLQTTFEATRGGFAGGPVYENKVPKLIKRDYEPGARVAVHRKDILNAKHFAHHMGVDTPMTDVVLRVMDWMNDNGHIDEDQIAMVKYYEDKMDVTVGEEK